jgi:hypothetical protein
MRNFDTDPDSRRAQRIHPDTLTFIIRGREFHVVSGYAPDSPEADALDEWNTITSETPNDEFAAIADRTIERMLVKGQETAWREARDPAGPDPITGQDLVDIVGWIVEAVIMRPLASRSGSSGGSTPGTSDSPQQAPIARSLTVVSPSQGAEASGG